MKKILLLSFTYLSFALWSTFLFADVLSGKRAIKLVEENGAEHEVGSVEFQNAGEVVKYTVSWKDDKFADHFLSMRPFKCLEGSIKYWCRVPYPYPIKRVVSKHDLTDLEYDLLFIWKGSKEYGINMWNGVYYQLELESDRIVGSLSEMDMDKLSAPPDEGNLRPVREMDLEPGEPSSHWLPKVIIE